MQLTSGRPAVLAIALLAAGTSTASAASATASGPAALALAGVVALYSPLLTSDEREAVSALFVEAGQEWRDLSDLSDLSVRFGYDESYVQERR